MQIQKEVERRAIYCRKYIILKDFGIDRIAPMFCYILLTVGQFSYKQ